MFAAGAALIGIIALGIGPTFCVRALAVARPWRSAEAAQPYAIAVVPGNITVAKGGDQEVAATLRGFTAEGVRLAVVADRPPSGKKFPMTASGDSAHFSVRLFDLAERTEYYVESNGVRSPLFRIDVANLPFVKKIDLEYLYPGYTGMPSETVPDGWRHRCAARHQGDRPRDEHDAREGRPPAHRRQGADAAHVER
jgi:hypothetical protein